MGNERTKPPVGLWYASEHYAVGLRRFRVRGWFQYGQTVALETLRGPGGKIRQFATMEAAERAAEKANAAQQPAQGEGE